MYNRTTFSLNEFAASKKAAQRLANIDELDYHVLNCSTGYLVTNEHDPLVGLDKLLNNRRTVFVANPNGEK